MPQSSTEGRVPTQQDAKDEAGRSVWLAGYSTSITMALLYALNRFLLSHPLIALTWLYKLAMLGTAVSFYVSLCRSMPVTSRRACVFVL